MHSYPIGELGDETRGTSSRHAARVDTQRDLALHPSVSGQSPAQASEEHQQKVAIRDFFVRTFLLELPASVMERIAETTVCQKPANLKPHQDPSVSDTQRNLRKQRTAVYSTTIRAVFVQVGAVSIRAV